MALEWSLNLELFASSNIHLKNRGEIQCFGGYPVWRVITLGSVPVCKDRTGFGSDFWN
jgi:hypothetical protein